MDSTAAWNALLEEFRSFGGRAENVIQKEGPLGLGLFPIDPCQPIDLRVPKSLLVPADNLELRNGGAVIKDVSTFPTGYAEGSSLPGFLLLGRRGGRVSHPL